MAAGLSGWGQSRATREGRGARVETHAEIQRAEAALVAQQTALRAALAGAADDIDSVLLSMAQAEDALLDARKAWTSAATPAVEAPAPARSPRVSVALAGQVKRARRASAPRPSFTYGSWV